VAWAANFIVVFAYSTLIPAGITNVVIILGVAIMRAPSLGRLAGRRRARWVR
jgi:hypothetical protein